MYVGAHLGIHGGAAVERKTGIVILLWSRRAAGAARTRRFHRIMAALILLVVFAQTDVNETGHLT